MGLELGMRNIGTGVEIRVKKSWVGIGISLTLIRSTYQYFFVTQACPLFDT